MRTFIQTFLQMLLGLALLSGLYACGVKAPPLPPESTTPQQSENDRWSPQRGAIPSPSPSTTGR